MGEDSRREDTYANAGLRFFVDIGFRLFLFSPSWSIRFVGQKYHRCGSNRVGYRGERVMIGAQRLPGGTYALGEHSQRRNNGHRSRNMSGTLVVTIFEITWSSCVPRTKVRAAVDTVRETGKALTRILRDVLGDGSLGCRGTDCLVLQDAAGCFACDRQ